MNEDREDKQREMLNDHHADLLHEEQVANCPHDDWLITSIEDIHVAAEDGIEAFVQGYIDPIYQRSFMECEVTCSFCGKNNYLRAPLSLALDMLNKWVTNSISGHWRDAPDLILEEWGHNNE